MSSSIRHISWSTAGLCNYCKIASILILLTIGVVTLPGFLRAASIADNAQIQTGANSNSNSNSNSDSSGGAIATAGSSTTTDEGETAGAAAPQKMFITILPTKPIVSRGSDIGYTVTASTDNGTAISDANISSVVVDYATGKNKIISGGQTNDKGELKITTQVGPNLHPGQLLITALANHDGFDQSKASTGIIISDKGSGSSSSSSSSSSSTSSGSGKCSGSGCK